MRPFRSTNSGFTLIELMVVIAIIALLVAIALPAFSNVRNQAKTTDTAAMFSAVDAGLELFKAERAVGGAYVPSTSDSRQDASAGNPYGRLADPRLLPAPGVATVVQGDNVAGTSFLVYGLAGADRLGTPGFRDGGDADEFWYNDLGNNLDSANPLQSGLHALHGPGPDAGQAVHPRYGRLVGDNVIKRIETIQDLIAQRVIVNDSSLNLSDAQKNQQVLVDAWDRPLLYYRARSRAGVMVTNLSAAGKPGTYDQRDNQVITGINGSGAPIVTGMDFGAGAVRPTGEFHRITRHQPAAALYAPPDDVDVNALFDDTFTRFIWDPKGKPRNLAFRPDSYLLISAGVDGVFGTGDDVTNFGKN